jgi:hypothetical protein
MTFPFLEKFETLESIPSHSTTKRPLKRSSPAALDL